MKQATKQNDWKETTLGEMAENISRRFDFSIKDEVIFINTGDILEGKFLHKNYSLKTGLPGQAKKGIKKDDILFSEIRPANKRFAKVDFKVDDYVVSTKFMVIKRNEKIDLDFLYLFLTSKKTLKEFQAAAESRSGTFPQITFDAISHFPIFLPPLPEQRAIAAVLSAFDDKIELLRKQNQTLEAIAQNIFKRWFVEFKFPGSEKVKMVDSELGEIPEGWRVGKLSELGGEITDYVANGSFASLKDNVTLYETKNYALFLRNTDLKSDFAQKVYVDEHSYNFLKKTQMHGGEIIISNVGDVGSVYLCPFLEIPMVLGNNVISLKSNYQSYFFTLFSNRVGQFLINSITGGSAQPKFNKTDFRNMRLMIPSKKVLDLFEKTTWHFYKKILENNFQIQTLSTLRDALLPKLMRSEVRVRGF